MTFLTNEFLIFNERKISTLNDLLTGLGTSLLPSAELSSGVSWRRFRGRDRDTAKLADEKKDSFCYV